MNGQTQRDLKKFIQAQHGQGKFETLCKTLGTQNRNMKNELCDHGMGEQTQNQFVQYNDYVKIVTDNYDTGKINLSVLFHFREYMRLNVILQKQCSCIIEFNWIFKKFFDVYNHGMGQLSQLKKIKKRLTVEEKLRSWIYYIVCEGLPQADRRVMICENDYEFSSQLADITYKEEMKRLEFNLDKLFKPLEKNIKLEEEVKQLLIEREQKKRKIAQLHQQMDQIYNHILKVI